MIETTLPVTSPDVTRPPALLRKGGVLLVGTHVATSRHNYSVSEDLAERLSSAGWEVICTSPATTRLARLTDMVLTAWRRRHDYEVAQVDVFSGLAFGWAEAVCWTLRRAHKPYILTLHGGNLPGFSQKWPGRVRRLLESASAVTAPSQYLYQQMRPYRNNLLLVPNPLDLDTYTYRPRNHPRPRLVWLRAFHQIYNPELAPRVIARLKPDFPDIHLTMIGPDKDGSLQRTQEEVRRLGLGDHIDFPGGILHEAVPKWLDKSDITINTANIDITPVSVLEAMAAGLCVVSTNVGGMPYLLQHEKDALLVPPGNPEAMATAIHRILTEPHLAARLSDNGRRKVSQFAWPVVFPQWEQLLEEAATHVVPA